MSFAITDLLLNTGVFKSKALLSFDCIKYRHLWDPDGGIIGFLNDAAIFTDVDRVKNTRLINRNLIYTKNFTLSAVGIAIEYHIAAQPRTPFCHYVAFHPQGSVSLDFQSPTAPCESSSLATSRGNKKFDENNRESYTSCTTPAVPLWWLAPPPSPQSSVAQYPVLTCRAAYEARLRGILFCPLNRGGKGTRFVREQSDLRIVWHASQRGGKVVP